METLSYIIYAVLLILVIIFAPFATVWSMNTLFLLNIPYTIWTWLATVWLLAITFGSVQIIRK